MVCLINLRFAIGISASSCKHHSFIVKANVVYKCKLIIGNCLLKCPKEIVSRCHQQCTILNGILLVPPKCWIRIFLCNTVKSFNKCLNSGRYRPKIKRRCKNNTVCLFDFGHKAIESILLNTRLPIPACIAAKTAFDFILYKRNDFHLMADFLRTFVKSIYQLCSVALCILQKASMVSILQ